MSYKSNLTYFFSAVAEQVLVHRLVAVLVVELGGHGVAVAGDGQEVLDVTDRRPPVELLGPHPGPRPHIASSWVTLWCREPDVKSQGLVSVTQCLAVSLSSPTLSW